MFAVYPALHAGPVILAGLLLLLGLAAVAFFTLVALRGGRREIDAGIGAETLVEALSEPAALATADGRIVRSNNAWIRSVGGGGRLPRSIQAGGLFDAMTAARRGEAAGALLRVNGDSRTALISTLGARRFLVRLPPRPEKVVEVRDAPRRVARRWLQGRAPPPAWTPSPPRRRSARRCWKAPIRWRRPSAR